MRRITIEVEPQEAGSIEVRDSHVEHGAFVISQLDSGGHVYVPASNVEEFIAALRTLVPAKTSPSPKAVPGALKHSDVNKGDKLEFDPEAPQNQDGDYSWLKGQVLTVEWVEHKDYEARPMVEVSHDDVRSPTGRCCETAFLARFKKA